MPKPDQKIYTKTGDLGQTSLLGGTRVSKSNDRVEAYGTLDELNSYIGLIRDHLFDIRYRNLLASIQENLFIAEAWVAADPDLPLPSLPLIGEDAIKILEENIDEMNSVLPELKHFLLPGGHPLVSFCHIARTVCRRAERCVIRIDGKGINDEIIIKYLNRLSDYLFVLARKLGKELGAQESPWITKE
jgi:cob(I)alamin adenosyltransferase